MREFDLETTSRHVEKVREARSTMRTLARELLPQPTAALPHEDEVLAALRPMRESAAGKGRNYRPLVERGRSAGSGALQALSQNVDDEPKGLG